MVRADNHKTGLAYLITSDNEAELAERRLTKLLNLAKGRAGIKALITKECEPKKHLTEREYKEFRELAIKLFNYGHK